MKQPSSATTYGTVYVIPTEDEWYKAAYFNPNGSDYSLYANGTNTAPSTSQSCYNQSFPYAGPWNIGDGMQEQNGTFDMMGNVWEWNETVIFGSDFRGLRGGSYMGYNDGGDGTLMSPYRYNFGIPNNESDLFGFRVASVPEPTTLLLLGFGTLLFRKRRTI